MLAELVRKNRSYRRFYQDVPVKLETLRELVDMGRLSASAMNLQPLKYVLSCEPEKNALIFPNLGWAAYLKDWQGPEEGERPSAYIIILCDTQINQSAGCDHGISAQSILLGATEKGLGGCMIATVNRKELSKVLNLDPRYDIVLVVALGKPKENVVIDKVAPDGSIKYWHDTQGTHHVPKRALDDIIIG
jgi:nitroreductase